MPSVEIGASGLSEIEHRAQLRRALIASTIGTTIEWYDFLLYSTVTGLVFAKLFFPDSDPLIGTLQAYVIFYIGFVARPVGAAIFGHYGDRIGRKATLIATLVITGAGNRRGRPGADLRPDRHLGGDHHDRSCGSSRVSGSVANGAGRS